MYMPHLKYQAFVIPFVLETINSDPGEIEQVVPQIALWVKPRIEYLPGE